MQVGKLDHMVLGSGNKQCRSSRRRRNMNSGEFPVVAVLPILFCVVIMVLVGGFGHDDAWLQ